MIQDGTTVLSEAASAGHAAVTKILILRSADVNEPRTVVSGWLGSED